MANGFMETGFDYTGAGPGNIFGGMPTALAPGVTSTFAGDPQSWFQAARLAQLGDYAALPQFQRTANLGFTPAFGRYLLSGDTGEFSGYSPTAGTMGSDWQAALAASAAIGDPNATLTAQQGQIQSYLTGEDARRNALAMAAAQYGGGVGYGAQSRQRALGNLYDLYSARAAAAGQPAGGFLNYLSGVRT
tara:strand:+ start:309 stop:878 length:570 start_codon:yes stop_codon:yes gene_type:complete